MSLPLRLRGFRRTNPATVLAESPRVRDGLLFFSRERAWINERHLQLARIPAPTFFEQKRAEWIAAELEQLGCRAEIDRVGNVVALATPDLGGPCVALTAHLDTVLAPRSPDDIRVGSDGRFLGPGIADNGAGLAGLLAIAAAWREAGLARAELDATLLLVANVGEEGEGNLSGMRYLCRQSPFASRLRDFVVLDGPGSEHITNHALGSRRLDISFSGPGGHSWSDFGVGNPVHALAAVITDFCSGRGWEREPRTSINFGIIEGGASVNSIPSEARAKLDIRSESQERIDELVELLTDAVERSLAAENDRSQRKSNGRLTARIREIGSRPGGRLPEDAELLNAIRFADQHLGIRSSTDCASTDANIPLSLGLAAVSIGAGGSGGGAHTVHEWFHPEARDVGLRRVFLTIGQRLLTSPGNS